MTQEMSGKLVGTWGLDPSDVTARSKYGDTRLVFHEDGVLEYVVCGADKDQISILRYAVVDDYIVTDQPSAPRVERTRFQLTETGQLVLRFNDEAARYVRIRADERSHPCGNAQQS